jgi:hypothetical protein
MLRAAASCLVAFVIFLASGPARADLPEPAPGGRYVYASVAALEQPIFYNRFGSFNPYGTIYALLRNVVNEDGQPATTESPPGRVRLHDKRRPRPLVLRGNVGDILIVDFVNLLAPRQPDLDRCRGVPPYAPPGGWQTRSEGEDCDWRRPYATLEDEAGDGADEAVRVNGNWPLTRTASIAAPGLEAVRCDGTAAAPEDLATGMRPVGPGESARYCYRLRREGTFLFSSLGAPAGGEGDGGSLSHGLFGAINVQPTGSRWYRSQVAASDLEAAKHSAEQKAAASAGQKGADYVKPVIDYEAVGEAGTPLLAMLKTARLPDDLDQVVQELVHGDLTAIVDRCPQLTQGIDDQTCAFKEAPAVRDFTIVFHDEFKTFYPDWLKELESEENAFPGVSGLGDGFNPLAGVRDGFAINYGASGMGSILLANRKGVGPAPRTAWSAPKRSSSCNPGPTATRRCSPTTRTIPPTSTTPTSTTRLCFVTRMRDPRRPTSSTCTRTSGWRSEPSLGRPLPTGPGASRDPISTRRPSRPCRASPTRSTTAAVAT